MLFLVFENTYALKNTWDFVKSADYILSDSNNTEILSWLWQLKPKLTQKWKINNDTLYNWAYDVIVDWDYAYMTSYLWDRVNVINISNPTSPTLIWSIRNNNWTIKLDWASWIIKDGNYLYVASHVSDALQIIDVSNPASPSAVWQVQDTIKLNWARWITKVWNYVYIATDKYDALITVNVSNPALPIISWIYKNSTNMNWAKDVKISWNYAFVTCYNWDSLSVIDISNPHNPLYITEIRDTRKLNWAWWIEISWKYAYISAYLNSSVIVIDISFPKTPVIITNISGWNYSITNPRDLLIDDNKLFISSFWSDAINIADISNPKNPVYITKIKHNTSNHLLDWAYWLYKVWDYLYVASYNSDALEILKLMYTSNSPYIIPTWNVLYNLGIEKLTWDLWNWNKWIVSYQISKDDWITWYYLSWESRLMTTSWSSHSNTEAQINSKIKTFNWLPWWTWKFKWKAFLNWNWLQKVEIDNIRVDYEATWTNKIVNFETSKWYTVNKGLFSRVSSEKYEWNFSIKSLNTNNNSESCFEVLKDIYVDSNISFYKKVSSEEWYDFLKFYINWNEMSSWAWEKNWSKESYSIQNWNHTFKWCYEKDWSISKWNDFAFIDYIKIISDFDVLNWDFTPPNITFDSLSDFMLYKNSDFSIKINHSDSGSTINTWSILMELKKWDWNFWWNDISWKYINSKLITLSSSKYDFSKLWFWKYKVSFYIEDTVWNWKSIDKIFFIDEAELIVDTWSIHIWKLKPWEKEFNTWDFDITIKTVWAWFKLVLNKSSPLTYSSVEIIDKDLKDEIWYKSSKIWKINSNQIITSKVGNINTKWVKNIYNYTIKLWALVWKEQAASSYSSLVRFWIKLEY